MDQVTIFGDIHANWPALQAAWADMNARGLGYRYCLGDLVGYGTSPNEVIDFIQQHQVPTIMGNYDHGVGQDSDDCGCAYTNPFAEALGKRSIAWTNARTSAAGKVFLRQLPANIPLKLGGLNVLLVHGSPRRINEYLFEDRPTSSVERLMDQTGVDVLVCGHTHLPYHKVLPSGRQVVNAGSVGKPKDGDPRAGYVVLSAVDTDLSVDFIRVPYPVEQAASDIEASEMPHEFAAMLRAGRG